MSHQISTGRSAQAHITCTSGGVEVLPIGGSYEIADGADAVFSFTFDPDYHESNLVVDNESVGPLNPYTFSNVTEDHHLVVNALHDPLTIVATAGTGGSISPSGSQSVLWQHDKSFDIAANAGFEIVDALVDGVSVGVVSSYNFVDVEANHTIAVTFKTTITASATGPGSISPSGTVSVLGGATQSFTFTPYFAMSILDVLVDGVSQGAVTNYAFSDVSAPRTIAVTFGPRPGGTTVYHHIAPGQSLATLVQGGVARRPR